MADPLPNWRTIDGRARITQALQAAGHDTSLVWHVELDGRVAMIWRVGQPSVVVPLPAFDERTVDA
ncbi:hypothetical protein [Microbispora sp. CA-102843]|uniref:hypothetical protein n=1 Tax=Microbispora sp. CA-102843 TaxID=3239952 RepID=UPI003D89E2E5